MVAVRSVVAGTSPVALASLGGAAPFSVEAFASATAHAVELSAQDARPLAVSLVPPMLAILDAAGADGWDLLAEYDAVLVGGAATAKTLVDRLLFAGVHVFTSYGMTETCGGAVFDRRPLDGVQVEVEPDGRLAISGEQVALGYRDGRDPGSLVDRSARPQALPHRRSRAGRRRRPDLRRGTGRRRGSGGGCLGLGGRRTVGPRGGRGCDGGRRGRPSGSGMGFPPRGCGRPR